MKLPETRIKVVTQGDVVKYYPQYKLLFWWVDLNVAYHRINVSNDYCSYLAHAKACIDNHLESFIERYNKKQQAKLKKVTTYIKYP